MSDLIDRQAAIDALDTIESEVADGEGFRYAKWREFFCDLPPAQPEQRVEELLPDGTLHLFTDTDLSKVNRVWVSQNNTHYGDLYYADEDPKRGKWIPCSERLPETHVEYVTGIAGEKLEAFRLSVPVLGYVGDDMADDVDMAVVWYEDDLDGRTGWQTAPDCENVNVIAWMPLPKPPLPKPYAERREDGKNT